MRRALRASLILVFLAAIVAAVLAQKRAVLVGRITDAAGAPVAGATVKATFQEVAAVFSDIGSIYQDTSCAYETTSDGDGHYRLRLHSPLSRVAYSFNSGDNVYHLQVAAGNLGRVHRKLQVKYVTENTADFQLGPPGTELKGRIVDSRDRPLAHCRYSIQPRYSGSDALFTGQSDDRQLAMAFEEANAPRADAEGRFTISGIPAGAYQVFVWQDGTCVPSQDGLIQAEPGKTIDMDFKVYAPEDKATLVAEVVDESGAPLPVFHVLVLKTLRPDGCPIVVKAKTEGLPPGQFEGDNMEPGDGQVLLAAPGRSNVRFNFQLEPGETTRMRFLLGTGGTVAGTIRPFIDRDLSRVSCRAPEGLTGYTCLMSDTGAFSVDHVVPGRYLLLARNTIKETALTRKKSVWITVEQGRTTTVDLDLAEGPAEVYGRLCLPADGVAGWILVRECQAPDVTEWHDPISPHDGTLASMSLKNQDSYRIPGLPEGEYKIAAFWIEITDPEAAKWRRGGTRLHQRNQAVILKQGQPVQADFDFAHVP